MWLRTTNILEDSGAYTLNFLYREKNVYIMDNHLAAAWAWAQEIDPTKKYKIFHIDRHYDLMCSNLESWIDHIRQSRLDLKTCSIEEYIQLQFEITELYLHPIQLFRWDNYFPIFLELFSNSIESLVFVTHDDGSRDQNLINKAWRDETIWDLPENLSYWITRERDCEWILNIDIDFFFTGEESQIQFLTDEYIKKLCDEILKCKDKIAVITIALSPDFTNGWEQAKRVSELIAHYLGLEFSFPVALE